MKDSLPKMLGGIVTVLATITAFSFTAFADGPVRVSNDTQTSHLKLLSQRFVMREARELSITERIIPVVVSGNAPNATGIQIANHIVGKIESSRVIGSENGLKLDAEPFTWLEHQEAFAVDIYLYGTHYGPYYGDDWEQGVEEVVADAPMAIKRQATDHAKKRTKEGD